MTSKSMIFRKFHFESSSSGFNIPEWILIDCELCQVQNRTIWASFVVLRVSLTDFQHPLSTYVWTVVHMVNMTYFAQNQSIISISRGIKYRYMLQLMWYALGHYFRRFGGAITHCSSFLGRFAMIYVLLQWGAVKNRLSAWDLPEKSIFSFSFLCCLYHSKTHVLTNFERPNSLYVVSKVIFDFLSSLSTCAYKISRFELKNTSQSRRNDFESSNLVRSRLFQCYDEWAYQLWRYGCFNEI